MIYLLLSKYNFQYHCILFLQRLITVLKMKPYNVLMEECVSMAAHRHPANAEIAGLVTSVKYVRFYYYFLLLSINNQHMEWSTTILPGTWKVGQLHRYRKEIPKLLYHSVQRRCQPWSSSWGYSDFCPSNTLKQMQTKCDSNLCAPCGVSRVFIFTLTGADPGYVKRGGRDPKGGARWLI